MSDADHPGPDFRAPDHQGPVPVISSRQTVSLPAPRSAALVTRGWRLPLALTASFLIMLLGVAAIAKVAGFAPVTLGDASEPASVTDRSSPTPTARATPEASPLRPPAAHPWVEHDHSVPWTHVPRRGWECVSVEGASACFAHHGEYFRLRDDRADGRAVVVDWTMGDSKSGRQGQIWDLLGAKESWTYRNKSFLEVGVGEMRVCVGGHSDTQPDHCSREMMIRP